MKSFLYLEPYVYININEKEGLILNTFNHLLYTTSDAQVLAVLRELIASDRGHLIEYDSLLTNELRQFIDWLRKSYSGDFLPLSDNQCLPFQLLPSIENFSFTEIKENKICDILFYLNSSCSLNCQSCNLYHKQTPFCKNDNREILSPQQIQSFLQEVGKHRINRISLVGGDIFNESLKEYTSLFENIKCEKHIYIHIDRISATTIDLLNQCRFKLVILIPAEYCLNTFIKKSKMFTLLKYKYIIKKIITDEVSLKSYYSKFPNINYMPIYHQNMSFFEKYVFMDKEDISCKKVNMQELFNNYNFNSFFMGKIIVNSDAKVYVSFEKKPIGNIKNQETVRTLLKDLYEKQSLWRLTRKDVKPCNACIFNTICPPLSNYELAIKRNNLCKYWNHNVTC